DYAWGDVDKDGDTDLVIVRKEPFTKPGKRVNVLLMNENGVLVDSTQEYATASDVPGDAGFATPTNDRDVVLVDVDGDGWLDIVTATTLTDNQAKHISHPRVYMNLRDEPPGSGNWLGFEYQDARIPQMHPTAGPRFCSVAAGDVTGDGYPDLYFSDYDDGVTNPPPQIHDYNDKLLTNDGTGFFTDESTLRMTPEMLLSNFGTASAIGDMNNDGVMDVVKLTALGPYEVAVIYNDPDNEGFFDYYDIIATGAPYFFSIGYLNGDAKLDLVIVDDGADRFKIAGNNDGSGHRNYIDGTFPNSNGFGGNSLIADLNNDDLNDVIITDVDVDVPGCNGSTHIYQNQGGDMPSFVEETSAIPESMRIGWHDVAVLDINGDGWLDVVAGRCSGTQVWISQPPLGIEFAYPEGLPDLVTPEEPHSILVQLTPIGDMVDPATALVHYAVDGGMFVEAAMQDLGDDLFEAVLPAAACLSPIDFYFSAELAGGSAFRDPPAAPTQSYTTFVANGFEIAFSDAMEGDVSAWTIESDPSLDSGEWEQADPNGTIFSGHLAAPNNDATPGDGNIMAFVTQNCMGDACNNASDSDVDGGPTYLISPTFDLSGTDATIRYARWFYTSSSDGEDSLLTEISNDGGQSWTSVHATTATDSAWEVAEFAVSDFVTPSAEIRVRFGVADAFEAQDSSIVEAGIDDFVVERLACEPMECEADLDGDGSVGAFDLAILLGAWGPVPTPDPPDFDGDGDVDAFDLAILLGAWGSCP
ncbi:MAG: FG-GAP-like repeat-containing protein, partial [Planctomycetota bacterium]|nr:FG-GAP-like repeat-containing protein [Planctomycetota bacterium]